MGPNVKKRSRQQYVKYRLKVLRECCIPPPKQEVVARMLDESKMTDGQVDAIFYDCIQKAR